MNFNIKLVQRIGYSLIAVSLILFSVSVLSVYTNSDSFNKTISPDSSASLTLNKTVSAGDDILYSITPANSTPNLLIYLSGPSGQKIGWSNLSGSSYTLTKQIVSPESGTWSLVVFNNNRSSDVSVKVTLGHIGYLTLSLFLLGFAFLPSGIALVVLTFVIKRKESNYPRYRY